MSEDTLASMGRIHKTDLGRDAVHVAVLSCTATNRMPPGAKVVVSHGNYVRTALTHETAVGVIDPFIKTRAIEPGWRVWVFLYPNTITGLKHQWSHPVIDNLQPPDLSMKWIEKFASAISQSYPALMDAAQRYGQNGDWTSDNNENYKNVDYHVWAVFWRHFSIVTGEELRPNLSNSCPYTCSC